MRKKIREARLRKAFTQKRLAQEMHVTQSAISQWENGVTVPRLSELLKLCETLDISVSELLDESKGA
jgi:transcriptional regulator with XRE-family HTH domain